MNNVITGFTKDLKQMKRESVNSSPVKKKYPEEAERTNTRPTDNAEGEAEERQEATRQPARRLWATREVHKH